MKKSTKFWLLALFLSPLLTGCGKNSPQVVSVLEQQRFTSETELSQNVQERTLGELPVANSLLHDTQQLLAPTNRRYLKVDSKVYFPNTIFNGVAVYKKGLRVINVYAKKLILSETSTQPIFKMIQKKTDIKKLIFNVEELVIASPLILPGTDLVINSKKMTVTKDASISTKPLGYSLAAQQFQAGLPGQKGGDITLQLDDLVIEPRTTVVFDLQGGEGQQGGAGQDGSDGISRNVVRSNNIVYYVQIHRECNRESHPVTCFTSQEELGTSAWPTNGTDAKLGGTPGQGGNGGTFSSNILVGTNYLNLSGGTSGKLPEVNKGGTAGQPVVAVQLINGRQSSHTSYPGKDAAISSDAQKNGEEGEVVHSHLAYSLSKQLADLSLLYAKDSYKAGHIDLAKKLFTNFSSYLSKSVASDDLVKANFATQKYLYQLDSHADYYGNLSHWVPSLSLNFYLKKLDQNKERIFRTLYLTYWMKNRVYSIEDKYRSAKKLWKLNIKQTDEVVKKLSKLQSDLPELKSELEELEFHQKEFTQEIVALEHKIKEQARDELSTSPLLKVIRSIGSLATVIPAGQPVLGSIGTGMLTLSSMIESDMSVESILTNVPQIYDSLSEARFKKSAEHWNREWAKVKWSSMNGQDSRDYLDYINRVAKFMKPIASEVSRQRETLFSHEVPSRELVKKIQQLKMQNPQYVELVNKVENIIQMRGRLYQQMQMKEHLYHSLYEQLFSLTENHLTLQRNLFALEQGQDKNLSAILNKMEDEAKQELDYHFYLLKKSFEYRFLKTISPNLNYENLYERFFTLAQQDREGELTDTEVRSIYTLFDDRIAQYKNSVEREIAAKPLYSDDQFEFSLSSAELKELNKKGSITITLTNLYPFDASMENIRLRDIVVDQLERKNQGKLEMHIRPVGEFFITSDDHIYTYRYNESRGWIFKQNSRDDGVRSIERSELSAGLLRDLFGPSAQLFTLPGAIGRFEISLRNGLDQDGQLLALRLLFHCDYGLK